MNKPSKKLRTDKNNCASFFEKQYEHLILSQIDMVLIKKRVNLPTSLTQVQRCLGNQIMVHGAAG